MEHGREAWDVRKQDEAQITAAKMRLMIGYQRWDRKKIEVSEELQTEPVLKQITMLRECIITNVIEISLI